MIGLYVLAALIALGMITLGLAGGARLGDRIEQPAPRHAVDTPRADSIYDQVADELQFTPERPFTAGVETDIVQALRNIGDNIDPISPERAGEIRRRVMYAVKHPGSLS